MPRAECVAFANHKGGTGKTTSCLSIAGYLAKSGNKVLVVDFDPQASATLGLGIDPMTIEYSVYDAILGRCDGHEGVPITRGDIGDGCGKPPCSALGIRFRWWQNSFPLSAGLRRCGDEMRALK